MPPGVGVVEALLKPLGRDLLGQRDMRLEREGLVEGEDAAAQAEMEFSKFLQSAPQSKVDNPCQIKDFNLTKRDAERVPVENPLLQFTD